MKQTATHLTSKIMLCFLLFFSFFTLHAQYPGGVSTGTVKGWRVDFYQNYTTNPATFGQGTANATPLVWGYTGTITANELIGYDYDTYSLEYTGVFNAPSAGSYTFYTDNVDDAAWVYVDNVLVVSKPSTGNASGSITLTTGDHNIKVKYSENGGAQNVDVSVAGPTILKTTLDARIIRVDNAKLTGWYKASDITKTVDYGGVGIDRVDSYVNKAPNFLGNGNLPYAGAVFAEVAVNTQVNFNPGVQFNGDDIFKAANNQNGLMFRNGSRTMFVINSQYANTASTGFIAGHAHDNVNFNSAGLYKGATTFQAAYAGGGGSTPATTFNVREPKLAGGTFNITAGPTASVNNLVTGYLNSVAGTANTSASPVNARLDDAGLRFGGLNADRVNGAYLPEFIYYPFVLTATEQQKINTYLAIKYGIELPQDYINTSGATIFSQTVNAGYTSSTFGIGRELAAEALNQKQSQSQMTGIGGYDFLTIGKGTIATTNALNTGTLADGDYLLLGNNNGAVAAQSTEIPASFSTAAGCTVARLTREWKAQVSGAPGSIIVRAGSATSGSFKFPGSAAGIALLIDTDNDGDFTTGSVSQVNPTSLVDGVATFNNVTLATGNVITFAWIVTAPGGVSANLKLWVKANDGVLAGNGTAVPQWNNQANATYNIDQPTVAAQPTFYSTDPTKLINFNPSVSYDGGDNLRNTTRMYPNTSPFYMSAVGVDQRTSTATLRGILGGGSGDYPGMDFQTDVNSPNGWNPYMAASTPLEWNGGSALLYNGNTGGAEQRPQLFNLATNNGGTDNITSRVDALQATTTLDANNQIDIGNGIYVGSSGNELWLGLLPEAMAYSANLTPAENVRVQSYIALKYGLTLNQAGMTNQYIASDGTTVM
jgi:hypothetical protein